MSLADTPAPYTPFWCEENVCQLIATLDDPSRAYAVFISNPERTCILFQQAASARGAEAGHYVVWDYHVIVVTTLEDGSVAVLDRDSRLPQPMLLEGGQARGLRRSAGLTAAPLRLRSGNISARLRGRRGNRT